MKATIDRLVLFGAAFALMAGCAKTREATFADSTGDEIFAISDFGDPGSGGSALLMTDAQPLAESLKPKAQARALYQGQALVTVNTNASSLSSRLKFLIEDLQILAQPSQSLKIVFGVGKDSVTIYRVVEDVRPLNLMERALLISVDQAKGSLALQKTNDPKALNEIQQKMQTPMDPKKGPLLLPLLKHKIAAFGVVERKRNELKEETSVLQLTPTKWPQATHVQIKSDTANRTVFLPATDAKALQAQEQIFVVDQLQGQTISAGELQSTLGITTPWAPETAVAMNLTGTLLTLKGAAPASTGALVMQMTVKHVRPTTSTASTTPQTSQDLNFIDLTPETSVGLVQITPGAAQPVPVSPAATAPTAKPAPAPAENPGI